MEIFSALLALCAGNSPVNGEYPSKRPVKRSFYVFFDLRLNKHLSKQSCGWWFETPWCPLWRNGNDLVQCCFMDPINVCCAMNPLALRQIFVISVLNRDVSNGMITTVISFALYLYIMIRTRWGHPRYGLCQNVLQFLLIFYATNGRISSIDLFDNGVSVFILWDPVALWNLINTHWLESWIVTTLQPIIFYGSCYIW